TESSPFGSTPSAARFQRDRCPAERPPVTVATGGIAQWHTDEMAPRFQAVFGTAAHLLGSSIAHCGFEEGANDKALAKGRRVPCEAGRQRSKRPFSISTASENRFAAPHAFRTLSNPGSCEGNV